MAQPVAVDSSGGDVHVTADSGSVAVNASPPDGGTVLVILTSGPVGVAVPTSFGATLSLKTTLGIVSVLDGFDVSDFEISDNSLTATLGDGGGIIDVTVGTGDIIFQPLTP